MSLGIIASDRKRNEQRVARYMQEIGEIAKAGLSRRELLRMGLVSGGAGLAAVAGMRNFRPYWAHAADAIPFTSPPNTPFAQPFYHAPVMTPVTLNPPPTDSTNPAAAPATGTTEANRPNHQKFEQFLAGVKMYESYEQPVPHNFYPEADGVPPSTIWTFVEPSTGAIGPLRIKARYGEPVIHRVHNLLPADNGGFGINQTSTHLHNGHTASESDGGPTHFYDSGQSRTTITPTFAPGSPAMCRRAL